MLSDALIVLKQPAGEFCSLDSAGKRVKNRTMGEMEQEFLEALSSYYYGDKPSITDEEFELLKEELLWSGSKVGDSTALHDALMFTLSMHAVKIRLRMHTYQRHDKGDSGSTSAAAAAACMLLRSLRFRLRVHM